MDYPCPQLKALKKIMFKAFSCGHGYMFRTAEEENMHVFFVPAVPPPLASGGPPGASGEPLLLQPTLASLSYACFGLVKGLCCVGVAAVIAVNSVVFRTL